MQHNQIIRLSTGLLAFSLLLFGVSMMLGANDRYAQALLNFYQLNEVVTANSGALFYGLSLTLFGGVVASTLFTSRTNHLAMYGVSAIAIIVLLTLLSTTRWIEAHGGFPVIGSGQGIIKYFALLPLVAYLYGREMFSNRTHLWLNYIPVAMVLFWIGGMKFLELEAKGIEVLVKTSPFMSWMYDVFSVQGASNVIGVYDLFFAALLGVAIYLRQLKLVFIASLGCGAVFFMTQTFLFTTPGALSAESILSSTGQFVIKDIWFICNLILIHYLVCNSDSAETV